MNNKLIDLVTSYVAENIGSFHQKRIDKMQEISLDKILSRKNPYLYRAKNLNTPESLVKSIVSAYMISAEESLFGNWIEGLAMYVNHVVYGGYNTSRSKKTATCCIEGCCYGRTNKSYPDSTHEKLCGESFWTLISGEPTMYLDLIEPLGTQAKAKNDSYDREYQKMITKFTIEFANKYCDAATGLIKWEEIVNFTSQTSTINS